MSDDWEAELDEIDKKEEEDKKKKKEMDKKKEEEKKKEMDKKKAEEKKKAEDKKKEDEKKKAENKKKADDKSKKPEDKKEDEKNKKIELKIEKDYIELAKKNAENIKNAKQLPMYTLSYLQNLVELLGPTLDLNQVNELLKVSNNIFNKKLNEGVKKKVSTKANIKVGKIMDRNDKLGNHDDDYEDEEEEEEEEVVDDNIDNYV